MCGPFITTTAYAHTLALALALAQIAKRSSRRHHTHRDWKQEHQEMAPATQRTINIDPADPKFTPQSLRVVELRSLLANHNVVLPSSARKADLVSAVEEHIVNPARQRVVARKQAAFATSPSLQSTSFDDSANFSDYNPFQPSSPEIAPSHDSPTIAQPVLSSLSPPSPKPPPPSSAVRARKSLGSARTSASSQATNGSPNRRKTIEPAPLARKVATAELAALSSPLKPSTNSFGSYIDPDVLKTALPRTPPPRDAKPSALQLARAEASKQGVKRPIRKLAIVRPKKTDAQNIAWLLVTRSAAILILAWWWWYVRDSKVLGYCDHGQSGSNSVVVERCRAAEARRQSEDYSLSDLLPAVSRPQCTPCPLHAVCSRGSLQRCDSDGYIVRFSLIARVPLLRSAIPLGWQASVCKADSRRLEMIDELAEEVFRRVSVQVGSIVCGSIKPSKSVIDAARAATAASRGGTKAEADLHCREYMHGVLESELYQELRDLRDKEHISEAYFNHLWTVALQELDQSSSADGSWQAVTFPRTSTQDGGNASSDRILLVDRLAATMPVTCRLRLLTASLARAMTSYLLGTLTLALLAICARAKLHHSRLEAAQTDALTNEVLSRLVEQSLNASLEADLPAGLPASHLRDALLNEYTPGSKSHRKRVWGAVAKRVEGNSNVRTATKRWSRSGDWMRIWEWVGVVSSAGTPRDAGSRPTTPASGAVRGRPASHAGRGDGLGTPALAHGASFLPVEMDESGVQAEQTASSEMAQKDGAGNFPLVESERKPRSALALFSAEVPAGGGGKNGYLIEGSDACSYPDLNNEMN